MDITVSEAFPLGAHVDGRGTRFAVASEVAERVELCLFDAQGREQRVVLPGRTGSVFHGHVAGTGHGQRYGYRVHGPFAQARGLLCNPAKLLVDPYARAITSMLSWDDALRATDAEGAPDSRDSAAFAPRSVVVQSNFDWGNDARPRTPWQDTVLYEVHVKGFTQRLAAVPEALRGTYAGLAHASAIEHLLSLGVTAVELMPICAFVSEKHLALKGLKNYWGYNPLAFFAPHAAYASDATPGAEVDELKRAIKALHHAGIEVIVDIVLNHTAEGNHEGPSLAYRGLDNHAYYALDPRDHARYENWSGCGNSLRADSPLALGLMLDALRYWASELHVDGFRYDLGVSLGRHAQGPEGVHGFDWRAPFFGLIARDPVLRRVKHIAEPWDLGPNGYQLGRFPVPFSEWNGRFRDRVRDYWRSAASGLREIASCIEGSPDVYDPLLRGATAGVCYVTSHDGFTLRDLVSYERKHNLQNGEDDRDGDDHNRSWNCGAEGPTEDRGVLVLRARQQRNLLATLLFSRGIPMLCAGDELSRTQHGNNNAYCQDNELSWLDWDRADTSLLEWVRALCALRKQHACLRPSLRPQPIEWYRPDGSRMHEADFEVGYARALGGLLRSQEPEREHAREPRLFLILNAGSEGLSFRVPKGAGDYRHLLDSAEPARAAGRGALSGQLYVRAHSMRLLEEVLPR